MQLKACVESRIQGLKRLGPSDRAKKIVRDLGGAVVNWSEVWKRIGCSERVGPGKSGPESDPVERATEDELSDCKKLMWQIIDDPALPASTVGLNLIRDALRNGV